MDPQVVQLWLALLAAAVSLSAAIAVMRAGSGPISRRLAIVLVLEGSLSASFTLSEGRALYDAAPRLAAAVGTALIIGLSSAYLAFLAQLESPLARALRHRALDVIYAAMPIVGFTLGYAWWTPEGETAAAGVFGAITALLILSVAIGGLVVAVSAVRASRRGSAARARAVVFAVAFGLRDAAWVGFIVALTLHQLATGSADSGWFFAMGPPIITILYVPTIAYGMLRHQLFDIDLRIKVGIRRSTVVTLMLVGVLAAAKVAEFYLNKTFGFVAGGIAAGVMLFLAPRLNKIGDKVASSALPRVESTSAYVEFRKLEVYKAAWESALEGGEPTAKELATLARLRAKLGIAAPDAVAVEADARAGLLPA